MLTHYFRRSGPVLLLAASVLLSACSGDDPIPAPAPPASTAIASPATTSLTLNWAPVASATGYVIRRAVGVSGGTPTVLANTLLGTASTFTDSGLEPNTTYRYQIATVRSSDTSAFSAEFVGATLQSGSAGTIDVTADITSNTTWSADRVYRLTRIISVANGAVLTIQPGTRIIGTTVTDGVNPVVAALIVLKGARLNAVGTRTNPIVMTSAAAAGSAAPGDWGGVVIVGNASSNRTGRTVVEGPTPADTISWNGGTADGDNSGSLNYVRIEFAGAAGALNVELNCLSMYAVGRGTSIQNVQCLRGLDDHFEWFGGTVDGRNLVSYESGDDHFDAAEGYRGRNQFLIAVQTGPRVTPRPGNVGALSSEQSGFEVDGCGATAGTCAAGFNSTPFTTPVFANFTVIGPGTGVLPVRPGRDGGLGANIRRGAGGAWINGIIARWPESAISVFQQETADRLTADSLDIRNVFLVDNARSSDEVGADAAADVNARRFFQQARWSGRSIDSASTATNDVFTSVPASSITIATGTVFDFTPVSASPARTGGLVALTPRIAARATGFFNGTLAGTAYRGAADPAIALSGQWWTGWTSYRRN